LCSWCYEPKYNPGSLKPVKNSLSIFLEMDADACTHTLKKVAMRVRAEAMKIITEAVMENHF
jgi:hypothetical protein